MGLLIAIPLAASCVTYLWERIIGEKEAFPAGAAAHRALVVTQFIIFLWVYSGWQSYWSHIALGLLYALLAAGVIYLRLKEGSVSCGCFGAKTTLKLSWKLAGIDLMLSLLAFMSVNEAAPYSLAEGLFLAASILLLSLFVLVGIPESIWALKTLKRVADHYRSWFYGYKELIP